MNPMDNKEPIAYLSRTEKFSASHRLHSTKLTRKENRELYGKCNNANGHGHNYTVTITVRGEVSRDTGMIMNIEELKKYMKMSIMDILDHKNLDLDVPYFKEVVSTTENISIFIWNSMVGNMPDPSLLYKVKLIETDKNYACFRGEHTETY